MSAYSLADVELDIPEPISGTRTTDHAGRVTVRHFIAPAIIVALTEHGVDPTTTATDELVAIRDLYSDTSGFVKEVLVAAEVPGSDDAMACSFRWSDEFGSTSVSKLVVARRSGSDQLVAVHASAPTLHGPDVERQLVEIVTSLRLR